MVTYVPENDFVVVVVGPHSASEGPDKKALSRIWGQGGGSRNW